MKWFGGVPEKMAGATHVGLTLRVLMLCALVMPSVMTACSDDGGTDDFAAVENVALLADPQLVTFESVSLGETSTRVVIIANQSGVDAQVKFDLREERTANDSNREFGWDAAQAEMLEQTVTIQGGASLQLLVNYSPRDEFRDTGAIVATYNGGELVIRLETNDISPDIDGPARLIFGRVPAGGTVTKTTNIQNVGRAPLRIDRVYLGENGEEFDFCFPTSNEQDAPCLGVDEPGAYPETLNYLETVLIRVTYSPVDDGEDTSRILVDSDDPDEQPFEIEISANGEEPCILVSDENGIDFGAAFIGGVSQRTVTIENCSPNKELIVDAIALTSDSDEEFFLGDNALPEPLPSEALVIAPGEANSLVLSYAPSAEAANQGTLEIRSNDEAKSPLRIPVTGRGSNNSCPTAVAKARVQGEGGPQVSQIETIPLATVEFDGGDSSDVDGGISTYEWTIVERPADSTTRFVPNGGVANPTLFIDLAGRYKIELTVYDEQGTASCETSEVTILATPNEDVHVQLVWDTDGTDVDLHFLHPNGRWNASPYDCHWLNREPNWNNLNSAGDDPSLDIDDVNGFGPENINLNNPESLTYRVGAHYYSDHFLGASNVTIRIWLSATLVFEYRNKFMTDGQFWDVATIQWGPSPQVGQIDSVLPGFP